VDEALDFYNLTVSYVGHSKFVTGRTLVVLVIGSIYGVGDIVYSNG